MEVSTNDTEDFRYKGNLKVDDLRQDKVDKNCTHLINAFKVKIKQVSY